MPIAEPYVAIVPIKPPARGKSRLRPVGEQWRTELASAFARDTLTAALACPPIAHVLAVTDDFRFAAEARAFGCAVIPDGVTDDLNATLRLGAAEATRRWPASTPVVLLADLPCLRPEHLADALGDVGDGAAFVADADDTGTTLYTAAYDAFEPAFGPGSAAAHRAAGLRELDVSAALRLDVDEPADLDRALALGVGEHTARALSGRAH